MAQAPTSAAFARPLATLPLVPPPAARAAGLQAVPTTVVRGGALAGRPPSPLVAAPATVLVRRGALPGPPSQATGRFRWTGQVPSAALSPLALALDAPATLVRSRATAARRDYKALLSLAAPARLSRVGARGGSFRVALAATTDGSPEAASTTPARTVAVPLNLRATCSPHRLRNHPVPGKPSRI